MGKIKNWMFSWFKLLLYSGCGPIIEDRPLFKPNAECTELKSCITINYDGSICECSGSYIDSFKPH